MGLNQCRLGKNIVVNKQDDFAFRFANSDISGCCGSPFCLAMDSQIRIRCRFLRENLLGVVG
jgi:hypothetical protein